MSSVYKVVLQGVDNTGAAFSKLQANLGKAEKGANDVKKALGGFKTALAAAAGAAGLGALSANALKTADALGKTSTKLGVTTNELFQFTAQAELAGISTQTAEMALQRFIRRTAEAAQGSGEAKAALKELRLDADKLQRLPLAERMEVLSDAFVDVKSPADRLRLAFKLFDSEGAAMVNMLGQGSRALRQQRGDLDKMGVTLRGVTTNEIEDFNDSLFLIKRQIDAAFIRGLSKAMPQIQTLTNRISDLIIPLTGGLIDGLTFLLNNLDTITMLFKGFIAVLAVGKVVAFTTALLAILNPIGLIITAVAGVVAAIYSFRDAIGDFLRRISPFHDVIEEDVDVTEDFDEAIENLRDTTKPTVPVLVDLGEAAEITGQQEARAAVETNEFADAIERLRELSRGATDEVEDFENQLKEFEQAVRNSDQTSADFNAALRKMVVDMTGVNDTSEDLENEIVLLEAAIKKMNERFDESDPLIRDLNKRLEEAQKELEDVIDPTKRLTEEQQELLDTINGLTPEVKAAHEEIANLNVLYERGMISVGEFRERTEALARELQEQADKTKNADTELKKMLENVVKGQADLKDLIGVMVGTGGVKSSIEGCFSVGPVKAFDEAIKSLTGDGSGLGALGKAIFDLDNVFERFFTSGGNKFKDFVQVIIDGLKDMAAGAIATVGLNFLKNIGFPFRDGGFVGGMANGGKVMGPGGPREDKIPAMLSNGEFVIQASSVSKFGQPFFDSLNKGRLPGFNMGGSIDIGGGGFEIRTLDPVTAFFSYFFDEFFGTLFGGSSVRKMNRKKKAAIGEFHDQGFRAVVDTIEENIGGNIYGEQAVAEVIRGIQNELVPEKRAGENRRQFAVRLDRNILGYELFGEDFFMKMIQSFFEAKQSINFAPFDLNDQVFELFKSANDISTAGLQVVPREYGGPLERGQAAVVGESGPELFIPGRGGTVAPIARDAGDRLIGAVEEVRNEISDLRRQMSRMLSGQSLAGARA